MKKIVELLAEFTFEVDGSTHEGRFHEEWANGFLNQFFMDVPDPMNPNKMK